MRLRNCDGYAALWAAVLVRAFEDATSSSTNVSNNPALPTPLERQQARSFLSRSRADFQLVCAFANVNPDYILRKYAEAREAANGSI